MDIQLRQTVTKLLSSDDVEDKKVGLNILLNDQIGLEDRLSLIEEMMTRDLDPSLQSDIHAVYNTLYPIVKRTRIQDL